MKITIIGAAHGIGLELLNMALEEGHNVTALVRDPVKIVISNPRLRIQKGDILDSHAVSSAIAGQDAIVVAIGIMPTRQPVDIFSNGIQVVLQAMGNESKQKLIVITGIGAGDSKGHGGFIYDKIINRWFLSTIYTDKDRQESIIKASNKQWLIVRPARLTNGKKMGVYKIIDNLTGITSSKISRKDVADFILKELKSPTHFGMTPLLTY